MAGVALGDIHVRSAWQAWHKLTSTVVLRGRRGTDGTGGALGLAWGAPWSRVTPRHSAWQAWHLATFTFVLRGRRGTKLTSTVVFAWQAWDRWHWVAWRKLTSTVVLRGRRGTDGTGWRAWTGLVAGVAQTHIYRRFAWQAWDRWHWVARLDWLGRA